jgi:hypothetical protein
MSGGTIIASSDDNSQTFPDDAQADSYIDWGTADVYEHFPGVVVLPVALTATQIDDGVSPISIGRIHAPYRSRTQKFKASKRNSPPVIPAPQDAGAFVFVGGGVKFEKPSMNSTAATVTWHAEGNWKFYENCTDDPLLDGYIITSQPWCTSAELYGQQNFGPSIPPDSTGAIAQAGFDAQIGVSQANAVSPGNPTALVVTTTWFPGQNLDTTLVNGGSLSAYAIPYISGAGFSPVLPQATLGSTDATLFTTPAPYDLADTTGVPKDGWPSP